MLTLQNKINVRKLTFVALKNNNRPCAFILNPLSFFLWGWPVELGWNVWVSIIMFGVQCFAMVNIFNPVMSYLVDAVSDRGASVTAAANFVRMIWTFALSLIGKRWRHFLQGFFCFPCSFIVFFILQRKRERR